MITSVNFTDRGRARFAEWLREVGRPNLIVDACANSALNAIERGLDVGDEPPGFELGRFYTLDGTPQIFSAYPDDLIVERDDSEELTYARNAGIDFARQIIRDVRNHQDGPGRLADSDDLPADDYVDMRSQFGNVTPAMERAYRDGYNSASADSAGE